MTEQPNFPVLDWGIVINPHDPDVVTALKHDYVEGDITLQEFEERLEDMAWI